MHDIMGEVAKLIERIRLDEVLHEVGVQRRGHMLSGLGIFAAGVVVGAAASLLLAPKSGEEMRQDLADRLSNLGQSVSDKVQSAARKGERYSPPS
jgi:hypothetical protein